MADHDKMAVAVCTKQFEPLALRITGASAHPTLPVLTLPFPFDTRPETEVRQVASDLVPALFEMLGVSS